MKMRPRSVGDSATHSQSAPTCCTKPSTLSPGLIASSVSRELEGPVVPEMASDSSSAPARGRHRRRISAGRARAIRSGERSCL
eukprot:1186579-Prorocentrum_minimum.AAC.1